VILVQISVDEKDQEVPYWEEDMTGNLSGKHPRLLELLVVNLDERSVRVE